MVAEAKQINTLINKLWKFIKEHDIPPLDDTAAWDRVVEDSMQMKEDYSGDEPIKRLFCKWLVVIKVNNNGEVIKRILVEVSTESAN